MLHGGEQLSTAIRKHLVHGRQHHIAHTIAQRHILAVGAVGHIVLMVFPQIFLNLAARHAQQRPCHMSMKRLHASQARYARSPEQVEEKSFHIVVAMVRHSNSLTPILHAHLLKPLIAQFTAGHFHRHAMFLLISRHIKVGHQARHTTHTAQDFHKGLVAVRLLTTQMKIAMCCHTVKPQFLQDKQQCHRVGTAAQRHQHMLRLVEQTLLFYYSRYFCKKVLFHRCVNFPSKLILIEFLHKKYANKFNTSVALFCDFLHFV